MTKPTPRQIEELNLLAQGSIGVLCPQQTAEAMARRGWVIIGDLRIDAYFVKITDEGREALAAAFGEAAKEAALDDKDFSISHSIHLRPNSADSGPPLSHSPRPDRRSAESRVRVGAEL